MKWYEGTIPSAIQTAKSRNTVFIVYISGEDDLSHQMNETWNDSSVSSLCESEGCVAVQIKANSDECSFFSQIYPVVVVPSTFFIGTNGTPLEVTGGFVEAVEFRKKITTVLQTHKSNLPAVVPEEPSTSSSNVPAMEASTESKVAEQPTASTSKTEEDGSEAKKPRMEDKVQKAKDLIEMKREEKLQKEKEEEKRKEHERIQMGKEVQKLKQFQKEREILETQQQLKKDREADRKARERVKEQIAQDRADRAARFNKEKAQREEKQEEAKRAKLAAQQQAAAEAEAKRSENARIQFRLPDGSSVAHTFPSGETLQQAYNFASQHMGGNVTLSTVFPRRTFTDADMSRTFIDLQLAPSAVVMVIRGHKTEVQQAGGGSGAPSGIMGLIFAPFVFILNMLRSLLSSFSSPAPPATPPQSGQTRASGGDRYTPQGMHQQKKSEKSATGSRVEGNVHRFRNNQDDDDDMTTWNGNSTQQM